MFVIYDRYDILNHNPLIGKKESSECDGVGNLQEARVWPLHRHIFRLGGS